MRNRVKALVYLSIILLVPCQAFIRAQDSTAPANSGDVKPSKLLQLEKPDVVKELKLTAEQITKISDLFKQRKEQLTSAKPEEQEKVSSENLKLLSEVLTEVQRKQLEQIGAEPKLVFNFRYQRWTDVLDWFATQSNLSLTMDAPPPGTFNYTDKNEYTPSEAIDLLNGVLQSKSYTLIRRNKMLLVLDISEGIQDSLIPKISLEELSKRGQFEYVSAIFPMEGRIAEEARKEIEPLLGQHGKIVVLQKTNQLMVTEMAGRMKSFEAIIKSIPLPEKPKEEEKPPAPELKSYDVKNLDSNATIQTLEKLFGEIKAVYDPKTNQLTTFTVPSQQAAIKKVLEQLQAGESATEYHLSVYDMTNENPAVLMENIQLVIPGVRLRHDTVNNTLVAWASPEEHKKIKETIEKLSQNQSGDKSSQVEIYSTRGLDANSTLATLQSLFPHAKLTLEGKSQGLIVIAPISVHQGIKAILEQFKAVQTKKELPQLKFYPYDSEKLPAGVTAILSQAVAKASVRIDPETKQLIVLATPKEHAKIETVLKQYIAAAEKTKKVKQLEIYSVNKQQQTRLTAMLATIQAELPGMSITTDTQSGEIAVWATADQHLILVSILEKLKSEKAEDQQFQLSTYPLKKSDPASIFSMLKSLYPTTNIILDSTTNRLLVWATAEEQKSIANSMEKLVSDKAPNQQSRLESYTMSGIPASELITILQPLVPTARLTADAKTNSLIAWGTPDDHEKIQIAVARMEKNNTPQNSPQLEVYSTKDIDPNTTLTTLQSLFPLVKITLDGLSQDLIVIAPADVQKGISSILQQFKTAQTKKEIPELKFYPYDSTKLPAGVTAVLTQAAPKSNVRLDSETNQLVVLATAKEHAKVEQVLKQYIEAATKTKKTKQLEIYSVNKQQQTRLTAMLATIQAELPGMSITTDTQSGEIAVWATEDQHLILVSILEKLKSEKAEDQQFQLSTYPLKKSDPTSVQNMLKSLYPTTNIILDSSTNRLLVWATAEEQKSIANSMEKLVSDKSPDKQSRLDSYSVSGMPVSELITILQPLVPTARLTADTKSDSMIAWGTPDDHEKIQIAVARMGKNNTPQNSPQLEVYKLTKIDPSATLTLLQGLFPNAKLTVDPQSKSLISIAKPSDQAAIKNTLNELQPSKSSPNAEKLQFHSLTMKPSGNLMTILQALVPQAKITLEAESKRVMAVATDEDHQTIKETIKKIESSTIKTKNRLEIYSVTPAQRKRFMAIYTTIQAEIPGIQVVTDAEPGELSIWAKPEQHEMLKEIISKLNKKVSKGKRYVLMAYSLKDADPQSALDVMTKLFPETKIVLDPETVRLLIWTSPDQHEMIQQAMEQIATGQNSDSVKSYQTYPVKKADMSILSAIVQEMFPRVTLKSDTTARTLIIRAKKSEHKKIDKLIKQLDKATSNANEVRLYPTGNANSSSIYNVIYRLVPRSSVNLDYVSGNLIVYGSQEDQEIVTSAMKKIVGEDFKNTPRTMKVYKLETMITNSARQIIVNAIPNVKISQGSDDKTMIVWARDHEHKIIDDIIAKIDIDDRPEDKRTLAIIPLNGIDYSTMMTFLEADLKKEAQFIEDTIEDSVIVRGKEKQLAKIRKALKDFIEKLPKKDKPVLKIYKTKSIAPSLAISLVRSYVPRASFTFDSKENRILVQAIPKDHKTIVETLELIDTKGGKENAPFLKAHRVSTNNLATINQLITNAFVNEHGYRITQDSINSRMVIFATEEQHQKISEIIENFDGKESGSTTVLYKLKHTTPSIISYISRYFIPQAKLNWGGSNNILYSYANEEDQARMKELVAKMDVPADETNTTIKSYAINPKIFSSVSGMVNNIMRTEKNYQITSDSTHNRLVVLASEEQHKKIASAIEEMEDDIPEYTTEIFKLKHVTPKTVYDIARYLFPYSKFTWTSGIDIFYSYANKEDQEKIKKLVAKMDVPDDENNSTLKTYEISRENFSTTNTIINRIMAKEKNHLITSDTINNRLIILASEEQHEKIAKVLKKLKTENGKSRAVIYSLKHISNRTISNLIRSITPYANVSLDNFNNKLIIYANDKDHKKIESIIASMDVESDENHPRIKTYTVNSSNISTAYSVISRLMNGKQNVQINQDSANNRLVVFATDEDHKKIESALKEIDKDVTESFTEVYQLKHTLPTTINSVVMNLVPGVKISVDNENKNLIVQGSEEDHEKVRKLIEKVDITGTEQGKPYLVAYPINKADPRNLQNIFRNTLRNGKDVAFSVDDKAGTLVVFARKQQHEEISKLLKQFDEVTPGLSSEVYRFKYADPQSALYPLMTLTPRARIAVDTKTRSLIVTASERDHKLIKEAIAKLDNKDASDPDGVFKIYPIKNAEPYNTLSMLQSLFARHPEVRITLDSKNNSIAAVALPDQHEKIAAYLEEIDNNAKGQLSKVYKLRYANAANAYTVLRNLVPTAASVTDAVSNSLIVSATEADHKKIQKMIDEMEKSSSEADEKELKYYTLIKADLTTVFRALYQTYSNNSKIRITMDQRNNAIVVNALPDYHEKIANRSRKLKKNPKGLLQQFIG